MSAWGTSAREARGVATAAAPHSPGLVPTPATPDKHPPPSPAADERSTPVADNVVVADGDGPVHFNTGDAGASLYKTWIAIPPTSAFHSAEFGYSTFTIVNATHAHFEWLRNVDDEKVVTDDTWVINKAGRRL